MKSLKLYISFVIDLSGPTKEKNYGNEERKINEKKHDFTEYKTQKIENKMKKNSSVQPKNIFAEMLNYDPKIFHKTKAKIFQQISAGLQKSQHLRSGNLQLLP